MREVELDTLEEQVLEQETVKQDDNADEEQQEENLELVVRKELVGRW